MKPIIKQTDRKGVLEAHRNENEPPFARILSPSFLKARTWGICYRDPKLENYFDETSITLSAPNYEAVEREMQFAVDKCNDYQLGLTDKLPSR